MGCGMKDVIQVLDEKLDSIIIMIGEDHLHGCFTTSMDLSRFSTLAEYDDGIFISEIFESVFSQIGPLFETFQISEDDKKQLLSAITKQIVCIKNSFQKDNKEELYLGLQQLRSIATKFQIKCYETVKEKKERDKR